MTLVDMTAGDRGQVVEITGDPAVVQRLFELGLLEGEEFDFLGFAPLGDPLELRVGNTRLSLRRADAAGVVVSKL
ncbi:MAG: ferrous iron transport protein A [Fimbriiglobus sp.]|jgi:ferrous iron transport protein A|nr:ferrous iron transport protein A [Fimbriiglobus sp.]